MPTFENRVVIERLIDEGHSGDLCALGMFVKRFLHFVPIRDRHASLCISVARFWQGRMTMNFDQFEHAWHDMAKG